MTYDDWKTRSPVDEEEHLAGCPTIAHPAAPCLCAEIQDDLDAMHGEARFDAEREGA